ncbi:MAG: ATP-binding cassette domain-containing protein [Microbacterium sp.]
MAKRGFNGALMRVSGAKDHEIEVTGAEMLTPHFRRVRFRTDSLFDEVENTPTAWIRIWFPAADGRDFEYQRAYTFSELNLDAGTFALDFVLHEPAGPASTWAKQAEAGQTLSATSLGSSSFEVPDEAPAGYLLIGDTAAIPAFSSIMRTVPADIPIEAYIEQHSSEDALIPLADHPRASIHWVPRDGTESLAAAIEARDWSDWHAWVTPETGSLKHLRTRLKDEFGFPKAELHAQAYWVEGRAMGKDRAVPEAESLRQAQGPRQAQEPEPALRQAQGPAPALRQAQGPGQAQGPAPTEPVETMGSWRAQAGSRLIKPLTSTFIAAGVLQAIVSLIELAPSVLLVELARRILAGDDASRLWSVGIWAVALLGIGTLLGTALMLWLHAFDARFERELRGRLLGKLARLPLGWFTDRSSTQVKRIVQDGTLSLHYLVTHAVPDAVAAIVPPISVLVYLFIVDWHLGLILFIPVLVYVITMYVMFLQSYDTTPKAMRWGEKMDGEAAGFLEGQGVIRVFGQHASTFRARLDEYIAFLRDWQQPYTKGKTLMDLTTRPSTFLLLIVVFGTLFVAGGTMRPVEILPFLFLGTTFGARLLGIGYGLSGLRAGMIAARRVQVTLDEEELQVRPHDGAAETPSTTTGLVQFDGVSFGYRPGVDVLSGIDLQLRPGTVTALVGPSGSGKSTLAALLARFHDVRAGAIRIDGTDVRELSTEQLYARVGFVFQQTQLVAGTVRENIALARPDAAQETIEQAARAAQIHERILRMPDGYDTVIGADAPLSGGEMQRLTIARAILTDTPVIVLDEATAYADPESEYLVQQALGRLAAGRTVLIIAHRLHTIVNADQIVVLDAGRIVERGVHSELLAMRGRYRQLWDAGHAAPASEVNAR